MRVSIEESQACPLGASVLYLTAVCKPRLARHAYLEQPKTPMFCASPGFGCVPTLILRLVYMCVRLIGTQSHRLTLRNLLSNPIIFMV